MRKGLTLFMVAACIVAAVVMYMYWNRETEVVTHGVLVSRNLDKTVHGMAREAGVCCNSDAVNAA